MTRKLVNSKKFTTEITMDVKNMSNINTDIGTVSDYLQKKKKKQIYTSNNDLFKTNVINSVYVPTKTHDIAFRDFNEKKLKFQYQWLEK